MSNLNFPYGRFPSFRNVDPNTRGVTNVHPPTTIFRSPDGETSGSMVMVAGKPKKFRLQKRQDKYPASGYYSVRNEKDKILSINKHMPIAGDFIFGMNPKYLQSTHYQYFGYTQQQVHEILDYEAEVAIGYAKTHFEDENRLVLISAMSHILKKTHYNFPIEFIRTLDPQIMSVRNIELFIAFCVIHKVIDRFVNQLITDKDENFDDLTQYIPNDDNKKEFLSELEQIDWGLFKCFSFLHTKNRFNYMGVCEVIEKQENENEIHFARIRYLYYDEEALVFLLSPNIKNNAQFSCYYYRTDYDKPIKLFIYDSYADEKNLKHLKNNMISKRKEEIKFVRGHFMGQIEDGKHMNFINSENDFFLMQKFPLKSLETKIKKITSDELWKKIHNHNRRKVFVSALY